MRWIAMVMVALAAACGDDSGGMDAAADSEPMRDDAGRLLDDAGRPRIQPICDSLVPRCGSFDESFAVIYSDIPPVCDPPLDERDRDQMLRCRGGVVECLDCPDTSDLSRCEVVGEPVCAYP